MKTKINLLCLLMFPTSLLAAEFIVSNPDAEKKVTLEVQTGDNPVALEVNFRDYVIAPNSDKVFQDAKYIREIKTEDTEHYVTVLDDNAKARTMFGDVEVEYEKGRHHIVNTPRRTFDYLDLFPIPKFKPVDPKADFGQSCLVGMVEEDVPLSYDMGSDWKVSIETGAYSTVTLVGNFTLNDPEMSKVKPTHWWEPDTKPVLLSPSVLPRIAKINPVSRPSPLTLKQFNYKLRTDKVFPEREFEAVYKQNVEFIYQIDVTGVKDLSKVAFLPRDANWGNLDSLKVRMGEVKVYCK